jgi:hypothetical protein
MVTRDQFFADAPRIRTEDVDVPGIGVVRVRTVSAGERCRLEFSSQGKGRDGYRARLVVASAVDQDGKPLFTYEDVDRISAMPAYVVDPIVEAVARLNAFSAADVKELEKNS